MKRRYKEAEAQAKENNRLMLERLSAYRIPVQPPQPPSAREIKRAEHEARKRRKEQEDQLSAKDLSKGDNCSHAHRRPDVVPGNATNAVDAESPDHASDTTAPSTPGSTEQQGKNDEEAQTYDEESTDEELSTDDEIACAGEAEKRKRFAWNYWMTDTDDDEERPAKRWCRRLPNGDKVTKANVILPGGYFKIEVDTLVEPKPRRRKRDDSDEGDEEPETLRRISEGRLVRRRVEEVATAIASDWEVAIVQQFVEIAAKYAQFDQFGESTGNQSPIESTEEAHVTDIEEGPLVGENSGSSSGTFRDQEDSGYFSAENGKDDGNESDDSAGPRFTAEEKGKMPAEGPRSKISPLSGPISEAAANEGSSDTASNASASPSNSAREKGKMPANGSRKKTSRTEDLATEVKAKIITAVVAAAEKMLRLPRLARKTPVQLGTGEWTDANGTRWKTGPDGKKLQRVAVKHWRRKYNLPADSMNPARLEMHRVLVDKWVDSQQLRELEKGRLLGWQDDDYQAPLQLEEEGIDNTPTQDLEEEEESDSVPSQPATPPREQAAEQNNSPRFHPYARPSTSRSAATRSTPRMPIHVNYRAYAGVAHLAPQPRSPHLRAYQSVMRDMGLQATSPARLRYGMCDRSGYMGQQRRS